MQIQGQDYSRAKKYMHGHSGARDGMGQCEVDHGPLGLFLLRLHSDVCLLRMSAGAFSNLRGPRVSALHNYTADHIFTVALAYACSFLSH